MSSVDKAVGITLEELEKFYKFLQGELPPEIRMSHPPRLSGRMAFQIIWYLQEVMGVIPDRFERCATCGCLYDSNNEGHTDRKDRHRCDNCDSLVFWREEAAKSDG